MIPSSIVAPYRVVEVNPEKQGLKRVPVSEASPISSCCRSESRKTRIETSPSATFIPPCSRVVEVNPEKQGLKHRTLRDTLGAQRVVEVNPEKQGLKQSLLNRRHNRGVTL